MLRLKGIIYLLLSSYLIWHEFGDKTGNEWIPQFNQWVSTNSTLSSMVDILLLLAEFVVILYWFKGLNFTFISGGLTMEEYRKTPFGNITFKGRFLSHLANSSGSRENNNIEKAKVFRDSKFSTLTKEQMANEYRKTAWLDGLESNHYKNASDARSYINSKLSTMDNETSYRWLKSQEK